MRPFARALALSCAAWPALAAQAHCAVAVGPILFGGIDPSSAVPARTIGEFTVSCSEPTTLSLSLGASLLASSVGERRMRHLTQDAWLGYELYQDATGTLAWGDGVGAPPLEVRVTATYLGRIHAWVPPQPDAWVGDYADVLVLTVLP